MRKVTSKRYQALKRRKLASIAPVVTRIFSAVVDLYVLARAARSAADPRASL